MILLNTLFNLKQDTYNEEWTVCLNNDIEENICSLIDENETDKHKMRLMEHISWCKDANATRKFRSINTKKCLQFLRVKGFSDRWLFLGAFDCKETIINSEGHEVYILEKNNSYSMFEERLIVKYEKSSGDKQVKLSWDRYEKMEVVEILSDIYSKTSKPFPGYDNVSLNFNEMVRIFKTPYSNWKDALSIINGIYVITDRNTGKLYVGSTYNYDGVWQRWMDYVNTNGHGEDVALKAELEKDSEYAYKYFRFTLLEYFFNIKKGKNDKNIIERESYWKDALSSREKGYNCN